MLIRKFFIATSLFVLIAGISTAQPSAETPPAEKSDNADAAAPADASPADAKPDDAKRKESEDKFNELLKKWTDLRDEMEKLQVDYKSTRPEDRKPLTEKFDELAKQGKAIEQQLVRAATAAYRDSKGEVEKAGDVLQSLSFHYFNQDRYERALAAGRPVLDTKAMNPRLYNVDGVSAYNANSFDLADKYMKKAEEAGVLDRHGKELLASLPSTKELWAKEKAIRDKEAKDNDLPRVELVTTKGPVILELFENEAPQAVANFINLVEKGFYNGLPFHRVIDGFVAQGGDPKGNGTGGPGYRIPCECYDPNHRLHFRGSLSMAHAGKDTGGSQFFLTFTRTPHLDGQHTVFGRVLEGMDNVSQLQRIEPGQDTRTKADKIIEARVLRKRDHAYEPTKLPE
jgi:cyclophilin family peptidyl-prolyl cis-trans isomerase